MMMRYLLPVIFLCYLLGARGGDLVSIGYDDGIADDGLWVDNGRGHAVLFKAPSNNWTLSKVGINGKLNPQMDQGLFVLEIWDQDLNLVYSRADNPGSYFGPEMRWVVIDVPDLYVSGDFYVCLFEFSNVYLGADLSERSSRRSLVVSRNPNKIDNWDLHYPQNSTDWMISVLGYSPAPEVGIFVASGEDGVVVEVEAADADGNLADATIYVIDEEKEEVVWVEQMSIEGEQANLTFIWPRQEFMVTNGTDSIGPIFAANTMGLNGSSYQAFSAMNIIRLSPDLPNITGAAYFDQEGKLHALIDVFGKTHYLSAEMLKVVKPEASYGQYRKDTITTQERVTSLRFFRLSPDGGLSLYDPLVLARSPVHHHGLQLEMVAASPGSYIIEVDVSDSAGNRVSRFSEGVNIS